MYPKPYSIYLRGAIDPNIPKSSKKGWDMQLAFQSIANGSQVEYGGFPHLSKLRSLDWLAADAVLHMSDAQVWATLIPTNMEAPKAPYKDYSPQEGGHISFHMVVSRSRGTPT